jgi:hypothetical protein
MTSIGIAGKALELGLHFTHRIHLEPDTSLKPHAPAQNFRLPFSITFLLRSICGKFL